MDLCQVLDMELESLENSPAGGIMIYLSDGDLLPDAEVSDWWRSDLPPTDRRVSPGGDRPGAEGNHPPAEVVQDELVVRRYSPLRHERVDDVEAVDAWEKERENRPHGLPKKINQFF